METPYRLLHVQDNNESRRNSFYCKKIIEVIEEENFKVLDITTDQGANFQRAFKLLNTLGDDFKISLNKKDYFIIRDPPHLLKRTRTHLANGDVILPDGKGNASWAHFR